MTLPDEVDLLVVEHDPSEAELLLRALSGLVAPDRIGVARDGEEALDWMLGRGAFRHRLGGPLPRLVLLEQKLPRLDGAEVLRTMRASPRTATVPAVVLSSAAEPRELAQCYQAGANSCVRKPIEYREYADTVRTMGRYWLRLNRSAQETLLAG
ncbi:MAG TPA: response regulator [Gemmatimonadales bacterium]|nr:response regulator [Gemmatimonadales bacterium]